MRISNKGVSKGFYEKKKKGQQVVYRENTGFCDLSAFNPSFYESISRLFLELIYMTLQVITKLISVLRLHADARMHQAPNKAVDTVATFQF